MRMTEEKYQEYLNRNKNLSDLAIKHGLPGEVKKRSKYGNTKVVVDGITFDSKKEYARWCELQMMEKAGIITHLERQVEFVLDDAISINGRMHPAMKYVADFRYYQDKRLVVEDVKSEITRQDKAYRIKYRLMARKYGIEIKET